MWAAVLYRQLKDIMSTTPRIRDSAVHYLTNKSVDLQAVCDLAELDMGRVIQAAKTLEELDPAEGVVYLDSLIQDANDEVDHDYDRYD